MGAFWEGVDFINLPEMVVVIPKIPFDNPKDPFVQKLQTQLKSEGKNPFFDYTLPVAGLRLKQAPGRSRRRDDQVSAVLLLDQRLTSKNYGKSLLKGLSKQAPLHQENLSQILSELEEFWYNGLDKKERGSK
jgi:ATP-dependent DNA helicase DinG